jgi:hypothetical protein
MSEPTDKGKTINRRELLKKSAGAAALVGAGTGFLGVENAGAQPQGLSVIEAAETDQLQVQTRLAENEVSVEIDGVRVPFKGGTVQATYKDPAMWQPTIRVLDVRGKVRRTIPASQLIKAHSPLLIACCCCCCCKKA